MPTLQDVARRAGVSTATVSKVLSNTPYFTEETRARVMQAVEELGYRPNLAARALSSGKTHIIAVVFPYIYDPIFKDPHVMSILEGIEIELTRADYNILLSTPRLSSSGPDENYRRLLRSGYIEGMVAIDNVPIASVAAEAQALGIPAVVIGYHAAAHRVHSDDYEGGRTLIQHILELGHRHIGVISVPEHLNFAVAARLHGLRAMAGEYGLDFDSLPLGESDFSTDGGARAMLSLMQQNPELTAVICLNDRMAMGAVQALHSTGRSVPDDVSVVGYDNLPVTAIFTPTLTTIDQQATKLGQAATQLLLDVLNNRETQPSVVLPPELIVRASSSAPRS